MCICEYYLKKNIFLLFNTPHFPKSEQSKSAVGYITPKFSITWFEFKYFFEHTDD